MMFPEFCKANEKMNQVCSHVNRIKFEHSIETKAIVMFNKIYIVRKPITNFYKHHDYGKFYLPANRNKDKINSQYSPCHKFSLIQMIKAKFIFLFSY